MGKFNYCTIGLIFFISGTLSFLTLCCIAFFDQTFFPFTGIGVSLLILIIGIILFIIESNQNEKKLHEINLEISLRINELEEQRKKEIEEEKAIFTLILQLSLYEKILIYKLFSESDISNN